MVPEQSERNVAVRVDRIHEWIRVDAHACSVNNNFVNLSKTLQKELDAGPNQDEHLDWPSFDNNPHLEVCFSPCATGLNLSEGEFTVNKSFIQVKDQSFATFKLEHLSWNHCVLGWNWLLPEPTRFC